MSKKSGSAAEGSLLSFIESAPPYEAGTQQESAVNKADLHRQKSVQPSDLPFRSVDRDISAPFVSPADPVIFKVCGIDEAGRGPLAGDVVAACVILDPKRYIDGIDDSKKLSEKKRDYLAAVIKEHAFAYGIGRASPAEIDELNILNATYLAMIRAYEAMQVHCDYVLIDGNRIPKELNRPACAVVKGDARVREIGAASLLAKTARDADLYKLDKEYPAYGFADHKGYPTPKHLELIKKLPLLSCYRYSFAPVRAIIEERKLIVMPDHSLRSISQ